MGQGGVSPLGPEEKLSAMLSRMLGRGLGATLVVELELELELEDLDEPTPTENVVVTEAWDEVLEVEVAEDFVDSGASVVARLCTLIHLWPS